VGDSSKFAAFATPANTLQRRLPSASHSGNVAIVPVRMHPGSPWTSALGRSEVAGTLSDGSATLERADLPRILAEIDTFLTDVGISVDRPVVFECANSLGDALTLLALLARGSTFVLVPVKSTEIGHPHPRFASHRIRVTRSNPERAPSAAEWSDPSTFVSHCALEGATPPRDAALARGRVLLRTSGSLGAAKLVAHSHASLFDNANNGIARLGLRPTDRVLIPVPLAHMFGLGAGFLPSLLAGASVSLLPTVNLLTFLSRERDDQPTIAFLTPNLCATLLRPRSTAAQYRHIVVAGDKLAPELFAQASSIFNRVLNLYGSTEMGMVCAAEADSDDGPRAQSVGRPLPGVELRLRPSEAVQDEPGEVGVLDCAHPHGFLGYVDDEGGLQPPPRWYDTRDLARLLPGGFVELLGRDDHALKRDGRLVMLAEVERALEQLPGVVRAAALPFGQTLRGRGIIGFCVPQADVVLDPQALRRECRALLPAYALPDQVRVLAALPLLPSGKLDRMALQRTLAQAESNPHE